MAGEITRQRLPIWDAAEAALRAPEDDATGPTAKLWHLDKEAFIAIEAESLVYTVMASVHHMSTVPADLTVAVSAAPPRRP